MMTPKEKAQELYAKYEYLNGMYHAYNNTDNIISHAKECALIAVDEILTWFKAHSYSNKNYDAFVFYNEVKQEIETL
jgi:hypothetical protein